MDIRDRIANLIEMHGENPKQMATASGVPYTTLVGYLKGDRDSIHIGSLMKIANHYGVTLDYLAYGENGLSVKATIVGSRYDKLDGDGKELIEWVLDHEYKRSSRAYLSSAPTTKVEADMGVVAEDNSDESATNA